jgi:hypothetical protein
MIVAIEGLIPDRRPVSAQNKPAPLPVTAQIYTAACPPRPPRQAVGPAVGRRQQQENPASPPAPAQQEAAPEPPSAPGSADAPPSVSNATVDPTGSTYPDGRLSPQQTASRVPRVPGADFVPDTRVPFSIRKNPWAGRR